MKDGEIRSIANTYYVKSLIGFSVKLQYRVSKMWSVKIINPPEESGYEDGEQFYIEEEHLNESRKPS